MQKTSHFIWIELKSELLSDIFLKVYKYFRKNNVESFFTFQNPLSCHITLYYLEKNISEKAKKEIKNLIKNFSVDKEIFISWFNYFLKKNWEKFVLYFTIKSDLPLENYRNILHKKYNKTEIIDNHFPYLAHATFFKIENNEIFEKHRKNIEKIIESELLKVCKLNVNSWKIFLYAVNSEFKEEIKIKV